MHTMPNHTGSEALVNWSMNNNLSLKGLDSLEMGLQHPMLGSLHEALSKADPNAALEDSAVLLACIAQLKAKSPVLERHYQKTGVDFVATWALASPMRNGSLDPNEKRFINWAEATTVSSFFLATVIGVRVLMTYRRPFDLRTLFLWLLARRNDSEEFGNSAKDCFSTWRAPADWMPTVDASRHDPAHCLALINELVGNGWGREELASRIGVTSQYLGLVMRERRSPSYGVQLALELLAGPAHAVMLTPVNNDKG